MDKKQLTLIIGSLLGLFAFLAVAYLLTSTPETTYFPELAKAAETDHIKWSNNNNIVLIEYSDFQCPGCASLAGAIQTLQNDDQFKKDIEPHITFVYRHFPLDTIHPNARAAAYAAEAASLQDAFFPMHDMLFARQSEWAEEQDPFPFFSEYAESLALDTEQFTSDYTSQSVKDRVEQDYQSGIAAQVRGTPSLFLNGEVFNLPASPEEFKNILLQQIN